MQLLQFAIIGCGKAAAIHAAQIKQYGQLVAVCDIDDEKGELFAQLHGAHFYQLANELFKKEKGIDVVVICSPNGLHASHAIAAMNAGFHVLVEKPMAIHLEDANRMIEVATLNQRNLFTVMQNRFNPPVQAVKQLLDLQQLGTIYSVQLNCFWNRNAAYYADEWHGTKTFDGGILFTQFSHFIDILIWFFGMPKKLTATLNNLAHQSTIEGEDQGVVIFEWANGSIGTMHYS
ncbi:MAG: Gfo/Idh/MocA family oxidoreductase, partial [Sediminibacterium sp.]|nr:Gfo/Idh/MocA family oxidoreductase [Sediminibacterium sp.]